MLFLKRARMWFSNDKMDFNERRESDVDKPTADM
jgi:hypothetical protein